MIEVNEYVGGRIRRRRRSLGLTQKRLGDAVGMTFQQVQKYECGGNRIDVSRLWLLACALDVPVSYFFEGLPRDALNLSANATEASIYKS